MSNPQDLKYSKEHEWLRADGTVGITAFAAEQVGDIVFVELPPVGTKLTAGASFGVIESVKAVSELFAPVSGEVVAVNDALADNPELISNDPYGDGWLVTVTAADAGDLMDAAAYDAMLADS